MARTLRRLGALAGIAGPLAFTAAWAVGGVRQSAYPVRDEHISGLAARDADHPVAMMAGFFSLGAGTLALGAALQDALGPSLRRTGPGPALLCLAGVAQLVAGALRRDTVLLNPPGRPDDWRQSRVNDGHDAASGVAFTCAIAVPLSLAARFAGDSQWRMLLPLAVGTAAVSGTLMAGFASDVDRDGNGLVQRTMVTLPQVFQVAVAARLLRS